MKLYERKLPGGDTSFYVHYQDNGKRKRHLLKGIHDRRLAEIAFGEFRARFERGVLNLPTDHNLTLGECLDAFIDSKRADCGLSRVRQLEAHARQMAGILGENTPVKTLGGKDANELKRALRAAGDRPGTVNKKLGLLKAAAALAVREGQVPREPTGRRAAALRPEPGFVALVQERRNRESPGRAPQRSRDD